MHVAENRTVCSIALMRMWTRHLPERLSAQAMADSSGFAGTLVLETCPGLYRAEFT